MVDEAALMVEVEVSRGGFVRVVCRMFIMHRVVVEGSDTRAFRVAFAQ